MFKRIKKAFNNKLGWALAASLAVHLFWLPIPVQKFMTEWSALEQEKPKEIRIKLKTESKKQVVNFANQKSDNEEKETDFVSKEDRFFEKEEVAKKVDSFKEAGLGVQDGREDAKDQQVVKAQKQKQSADSQKESQSDSKKKSFKMSDLGVNSKSKFLQEKSASQQMKALGVESGVKGQTGLAQNNDFVEDLPLGDVTKLNTKEYKYYGFYHRIRQRLEQHWGNSLQEKVTQYRRGGGRFPASDHMMTSLQITMDKKGKILNVKVKGPSGLDVLDEAAVESFNKAGPFPNPPQGMLVNGVIQIEWGFVVNG